MTDPTPEGSLPLFERATRRALLRRGLAATGALSAAALLAACGNDDKSAFASATTIAGTTSTLAATTAPSPTSTATTSPSTAAAPTGATQPAGDGVTVAFTYSAQADAGGGPGRVRNPFVAVWVDDGAGELAALLGVWYSTRDAKYLRELTEFTAASTDVGSAVLDAVSGATRSAGAYELRWDGTGLDGSALTGPCTLWIEAAREHGPHSVTSGPVTLGSAGAATIPGNGEISDAHVTVA